MPNEEVAGWLNDWEAQAARAQEAMASAGPTEYRMSEDNAFLQVSPTIFTVASCCEKCGTFKHLWASVPAPLQ